MEYHMRTRATGGTNQSTFDARMNGDIALVLRLDRTRTGLHRCVVYVRYIHDEVSMRIYCNRVSGDPLW